MGKQLIQGQGYPKYLLQLEKVAGRESFYIVTKSGRLLVAGSEISPSLHLKEDFCSLGKHGHGIMSYVSNVDYGCDQAKWRLWKVDKR